MIIKTPAIVLKSDNYRSSSKIVTFFTKNYGKIKCIAKGVRDTKGKLGGMLQPMCCLNTIIYYKENKTLHLVSNAEHLNLFLDLYGDFEKMKLGFKIIELINRTNVENHPNNEIFELLKDTLQSLNNAGSPLGNQGHTILIAFEFKLAHLLGFSVDMDKLKEKFYKTRVLESFGSSKSINTEPIVFFVKDAPKSSYGAENWNFNSNSDFNNTREFAPFSQDALMFLYDFFEVYFNEHFDNRNLSKTKKVF